MTDYYFRRVSNNAIEIAKFDDYSSEPTAVYRVENKVCNCPAADQKTCRHVKMVDSWKKNGEGSGEYFDSRSNKLETVFQLSVTGVAKMLDNYLI